jgi:catechol 2,3-dioxygenase-like lactoylglutathione lyase family enzyme
MAGMKATIGHIGINLSNNAEPFRFWKELLGYLEFRIVEAGDDHFDADDGVSYLCVSVTDKKFHGAGFHRKRTGLNHVALNVAAPAQVDRFVQEFLVPHQITRLYGGTRAYPDYAPGYYAVYFEDPDRIKVEIAYDPSLAQPGL